jgi:hypothetical protein
MKTALPAREEYYRLTRARDLRRKAGRLEQWSIALSPCVYSLAFLVVIVSSALLVWLAVLKRDEWGLAVSALGGALLPRLLEYPLRLAQQAREEADRLEAEHEARSDIPVG